MGMRPIAELVEMAKKPPNHLLDFGPDGLACEVMLNGFSIQIIASCGMGWDHVSARGPGRILRWDEMCKIKDIFFYPEECVMQLHPPKSRYVNCHPYVLHLWRPQDTEIPQPPLVMV